MGSFSPKSISAPVRQQLIFQSCYFKDCLRVLQSKHRFTALGNLLTSQEGQIPCSTSPKYYMDYAPCKQRMKKKIPSVESLASTSELQLYPATGLEKHPSRWGNDKCYILQPSSASGLTKTEAGLPMLLILPVVPCLTETGITVPKQLLPQTAREQLKGTHARHGHKKRKLIISSWEAECKTKLQSPILPTWDRSSDFYLTSLSSSFTHLLWERL